MIKIVRGQSRPLAILAGILWVSACAANQSPDAAAMPGSFRTIMAVKSPGVYGPHLPAADQPADQASAVPDSAPTLLAIKSPGVYGPHLPAADAVPAAAIAGSTCQPGSGAAILAIKFSPSARPGSPALYKDCH